MGTGWFGRLRGAGRGTGAGRPGPVTGIIVREAGRWTATPIDSQEMSEVDLAHVIAAAGPASPAASRRDGRSPADQVMTPVLPLVLACCEDGLFVVPSGTDRFEQLSADDVRLLDLLDRTRRCDDLADEAGIDLERAARAVARLAHLGAVRLRPEGTPVEAVRPAPPTRLTTLEEQTAPRPLGEGSLTPLDPDRIPVVAVYLPRYGPPLAAGMILANARVWDGGRLGDTYELRPLVTVDEARLLLADHRGPAVLLCSNYIWSHRENLALAEELSASNPQLIAVHGGPHTPKYPGDQERFMARPGVHVAVVGEGEETAAELLAALAAAPRFGDLSVLSGVAGVVFRDPGGGELVRTPPRERRLDLDAFPSPYLSGEFDDLHPATWDPAIGTVATFETNRGCPYKCTFCDWGSATMSRIRKFSMDRVVGEMEWLAERGLPVWMVTDANYGILPRDVEIAEHVVRLRRRTGVPLVWGVNTAKNATRNLSRIISMLSNEGITVVSSLALQTRDADTLEAIHRSNISPERYDDLAAAFRRERLPILCDFIVGLPGATVGSFSADLQWAFDHEVTPRCWVCQVLPNAPMNDPEYKDRFELQMDDDDVVIGSSTFTVEERQHMMGLRMAERLFEHMGLLRHLLRVLQWEKGLPALTVLDRLVTMARAEPLRYPLLSWALHHMDCFLVPPLGWRPFYDEVARFVTDELGLPLDDELRVALDVQLALMPDRDRAFPHRVPLAHDYVAYYHDATDQLRRDGRATGPTRPLASYGPGTLEVWGDPAGLSEGFRRLHEERPPDLLPGEFWHISHFELDSPLTRWVNEVSATPGYTRPELPDPAPAIEDGDEDDAELAIVGIRSTRPSTEEAGHP